MCRQMGYSGANENTNGLKWFKLSSTSSLSYMMSPLVREDYACNGGENNLFECSSRTSEDKCDHT